MNICKCNLGCTIPTGATVNRLTGALVRDSPNSIMPGLILPISVDSARNEDVNSTTGLVGGENKVENSVKEVKVSSKNIVPMNNIADSWNHILNLLHKS